MRGPSLRGLSRQYGEPIGKAIIVAELDRVANVCGGGVEPEALGLMASLVYERWKNYTFNALRLALNNGMNQGRMYGKLSYPVVAEWLNMAEERMENRNYELHLATKGGPR